MKLCSPEGISDEEFIIFKICHRMHTLNQDAEKLFQIIDEDGNGHIDRDEFGKKAKEIMDLTISVDDITKVFDFMDTDRDGKITLEQFSDIVNLDTWAENAKKDDYLVTKSQFMNALIEVYSALQRRDAAYVLTFFNGETGGNSVPADKALALAQKKEPGISEGKKG